MCVPAYKVYDYTFDAVVLYFYSLYQGKSVLWNFKYINIEVSKVFICNKYQID